MSAFAFDMSRLQFREEVFERRPHLWRDAFLADLPGWPLIDRALDLQEPSRELLKVLRNGRVEPDQYVEEIIDIGVRRRRIVKPKLYAMLSEGATLVINRIELVVPEVRDLCMQIGRFVGAQTSCNAYATLGDIAATNVHWDTHDVFIVQVSGQKRWRLYEPTHLLPISTQTSNDRKEELPDAIYMDEILTRGDVLYVPRGWWHQVEPTSMSDTIHLTIAVHTPLILDYLLWAAATKFPQAIELRHSLLGEAHDAARVANATRVIAQSLSDPKLIEAFHMRSRERERGGSGFQITRLLAQPGAISPETSVAINSRYASKDQAVFSMNGGHVAPTGAHGQVLGQLSAGLDLRMVELSERLPDLAWTSLVEVVRDLARADFVSFPSVEARPSEACPADNVDA